MRDALAPERVEEIYDRIAKRYDSLHASITAGADGRGRRIVVEKTVKPGDHVLDCGAGTGSTAILAARAAGPDGRVTLFDQSEGMLAVAESKVRELGLHSRMSFRTGDMLHLPFEDDSFDAVLSTYSMCPLYDPDLGALELLRVLKPGGKGGIAHSTEPSNRLMRWLADGVETIAWRFPMISMGCRAVHVLPAMERAGARVMFHRVIGVPLWPFEVFVVEKPA